MRLMDVFRKPNDPRKDQLREALEESDLFLGDEVAWIEIRAVIERELEKPLPHDLEFGKPKHPHRYLTLVLWGLVTEKLMSGELHIYRGVLSGRGQSYRSIAEKLTSQMIAFGDLKGSQDEEELAELDEVISKEG